MEPLWNSFFLFVIEQPTRAIGSGGFRGSPRAGRVEIGYNVAAKFQRQGVATAAVLMLIDRAFASAEVGEVFAETSIANAASRRVVEKAGFLRVGPRMSAEDGEMDQWLYTRREIRGSSIELPSSIADRSR
ncbi:MAG: N-acetyltransferase [Betaproteobacteria bacterium]|nr:MAG: N-acetyltransferase [Betaproteobacteria bacterium]